jgi:hypothetical protein
VRYCSLGPAVNAIPMPNIASTHKAAVPPTTRSAIRNHRHLTGAQIRSPIMASTRAGHRKYTILLHKSGQQGIAIPNRSLQPNQASIQSEVPDFKPPRINTQLLVSRITGSWGTRTLTSGQRVYRDLVGPLVIIAVSNIYRAAGGCRVPYTTARAAGEHVPQYVSLLTLLLQNNNYYATLD